VASKPIVRTQPIWWHLFDVTVVAQIEQAFHLVRVGRKFLGLPVRALNLKDGQLAGSAFFANRDPAELSPADVRWGPSRPEDVGSPPLVITKPKAEGKTAGFFVRDARGDRYLLKLDPADAPELLSGAEVVASKLLYALGYHVPSYEITYLSPRDLRIGPGVQVRGAEGQLRAFTEEDLRELLDPRARNGRVRVVASKLLEGEITGPARFWRFRDCAEIRALRLAYAWLNNIDTKDHNSLLVWDGSETVGYLIYFGTALGADAGRGGPKHPCAGWTNIVDLEEASLKLLTLGLHRSGCNPREQPFSPRVGLLTDRFDPVRWKPYAPNLAFEEMNDDDARWIAKRMARLSRAQLEAAVSAGQYSNPADASRILEVLDARRQTIIHQYEEDE
jgi:hypothetical protein